MNVILPKGNVRRAINSQHPHTRLARIHFAIAVRAHAAARTVAQIFRTAHWAGHACRVEDALSAHAAVEKRLLGSFFDGKKDSFKRARGDRIFFQEFHVLSQNHTEINGRMIRESTRIFTNIFHWCKFVVYFCSSGSTTLIIFSTALTASANAPCGASPVAPTISFALRAVELASGQ